MLSTLIYRSRARDGLGAHELEALEQRAQQRNASRAITGILLFDGIHFLQLLEGPEEAVQRTYLQISRDPRHHHVVELMHDYGPRRKFEQWGMRVFDLQGWQPQRVEELVSTLLQQSRVPRTDRTFKLLHRFSAGAWRCHTPAEAFNPLDWSVDDRGCKTRQVSSVAAGGYRFALQPIVNTATESISSFEALLRSANGGPPSEVFRGLAPQDLYVLDLETKRDAVALAAKLGIGECKLAINLMPSSLTIVADAVERLVRSIDECGLAPEQLIVEVTENEAISHFEEFASALKKLRGVGIGVAIDDFGSGFAGLAMLTRFQPEELKIDREIVRGIESNAARQAIVRAIVQCCSELGITVVAEGVETLAEWNWLRHAGIDLYQGYLFARPALEGIAPVAWPTRLTAAQL